MGRIAAALRGSLGVAILVLAAGSTVARGDGGGIGAPGAPKPADATCIEGCLDIRIVAIGGKVAITGDNLGAVKSVFFPARDGRYVGAEPRKVGPHGLQVKVPKGADSGRPVVVDGLKQSGTVPTKLKVKSAGAVTEPKRFKITSAKVSPRKSFVGGRSPTATYVFRSDKAVDVRLDILEAETGQLVDSIVQRHREPFATHSIEWDGRTSSGGPAANGKYKMALTPLAGGERAKLKLRRYSHIFPLRGKHEYGDGLGAGRGHMGQDVFGPCGKPIVAARGGRVTFSKFHSRAGYYVVIDGAETNVDYFYAHMKEKGRAKRGQRVRTGEVIGYNSDTGNASGCHLHFEMWKGHWQQGGKVVSPTGPLKAWDSWS